MDKQDQIHFRHIRVRNSVLQNNYSKKIYDLTLAIRIDEQNKCVTIGVSVVSHRQSYDKAEGRARAVERLTYNPTFKLPFTQDSSLLENRMNSVKYWVKEITGMAVYAPTYLRNLVLEKQREFHQTTFGLQVKAMLEREKEEKKDLEKRRIADIKSAGLRKQAAGK